MKTVLLITWGIFLTLSSLGLDAQKTGSRKNQVDPKYILELDGLKINLLFINLDTLTNHEFKRMIKAASYFQTRLILQRDLDSWKLRVQKGIADSSINIKKELGSIRKTKRNIKSGLNYSELYCLIIDEWKKRSPNSSQPERFQKRLSNYFARQGKSLEK